MIAEGCLESETQIDSLDYKLFAADVRDKVVIEKLLSGVQKDLPTLVLTECLLVYMRSEDSEMILSNFARLFLNVGFVNYEMIGPDDKFGQQMIENIEMRGCSLLGIRDCPTTKA